MLVCVAIAYSRTSSDTQAGRGLSILVGEAIVQTKAGREIPKIDKGTVVRTLIILFHGSPARGPLASTWGVLRYASCPLSVMSLPSPPPSPYLVPVYFYRWKKCPTQVLFCCFQKCLCGPKWVLMHHLPTPFCRVWFERFQVSYLGFCGTLGADYMQYMIADETLVPQESRRFYTEKMMYMPHSYFVNDHKQARVIPPST